MATDGVDFIDEDDARSLGLGLFEQVADARRADTDEEFDELGRGAREERHTGFTGDRLGDQGLTGTRRTDQKATLRDLGAERGVLVWVLQKVDDFLQFQLGAFDTGDVRERHAGFRNFLELGLGLTEVHGSTAHTAHATHAAVATLRAAEQEEQTAERHEREQQVTDQRGDVALLFAFADGDIDTILGQDVDEFRIVGQDDGRARTVDRGQLQRGAILGEAHALNLAAHHRLDEFAVAPVVPFRQPIGVHRRRLLGRIRERGHRLNALLLHLFSPRRVERVRARRPRERAVRHRRHRRERRRHFSDIVRRILRVHEPNHHRQSSAFASHRVRRRPPASSSPAPRATSSSVVISLIHPPPTPTARSTVAPAAIRDAKTFPIARAPHRPSRARARAPPSRVARVPDPTRARASRRVVRAPLSPPRVARAPPVARQRIGVSD